MPRARSAKLRRAARSPRSGTRLAPRSTARRTSTRPPTTPRRGATGRARRSRRGRRPCRSPRDHRPGPCALHDGPDRRATGLPRPSAPAKGAIPISRPSPGSPVASMPSAILSASSRVSTIACSGTVLITSPRRRSAPCRCPTPPRDRPRGPPRTVDHAAHHGHAQQHLHTGEPGGDLVGELVDVDLRPAAGRAGDDLQLPRTQVQRLQDLGPDLDLLDRWCGQRHPNRVADALGQQRPERDGRLDRPLERRAASVTPRCSG